MPDGPPVPEEPRQGQVETRELKPVTARAKRRPGRPIVVALLCIASAAAGYTVGRFFPAAPTQPAEKAKPTKKATTQTPTRETRERRPLATIASASARVDPTRVVVRFSQPVDRAAAETAANYAIDPGATVRAASLANDGTTVTLTTLPLQDGVTYTLAVRGVPVHASSAASHAQATTFAFSSSRRVADGLVALYDFEEAKGGVVNDVSRAGVPLNLRVRDLDAVEWVPGGLAIRSRTLIASPGPGHKITAACRETNSITIEAWLKPANTSQGGPARIVTLSKDTAARNFALGQEAGRYDVRLRTTTTGEQGAGPSLATQSGVATRLTHVVYTRDAAGRATIYINGALAVSGPIGGDMSTWDDTCRFGLGNELTSDRTWLGELHLVAIYSRALTADEVAQNHKPGPEGKTGKD